MSSKTTKCQLCRKYSDRKKQGLVKIPVRSGGWRVLRVCAKCNKSMLDLQQVMSA